MSSNENNTSSLQAAIDGVTGAAQSALGYVTGSTGDRVEGEARKDKASAEHEASNTVGKVGPFAVSGSGGVAKDSSDRTQGAWDQNMGNLKAGIGGALGSDQLKREGEEQAYDGKGREAAGQLNDLGKGMSDRVTGTLGGVGAALTGDREGQQAYADKHDDGKTLLRSAQADIEKAAK